MANALLSGDDSGVVELQTLLLQGNAIGDVGMRQLMVALPNCDRLKTLDIRRNQITGVGLSALITSLGTRSVVVCVVQIWS